MGLRGCFKNTSLSWAIHGRAQALQARLNAWAAIDQARWEDSHVSCASDGHFCPLMRHTRRHALVSSLVVQPLLHQHLRLAPLRLRLYCELYRLATPSPNAQRPAVCLWPNDCVFCAILCTAQHPVAPTSRRKLDSPRLLSFAQPRLIVLAHLPSQTPLKQLLPTMDDDNRITITVCGDGGCGMSWHHSRAQPR